MKLDPTPPPSLLPPSEAEIRAALAAAGYSPGRIDLMLKSWDPLAGSIYNNPISIIYGEILAPNDPRLTL